MTFQFVHDRLPLATYLQQTPGLHAYSLGDLDDFFWPRTCWYGWAEHGHLQAVMLLYAAPQLPTLIALAPPHDQMALAALWTSGLKFLPAHLYAHLSLPLVSLVETAYQVKSHGLHERMTLSHSSTISSVDTTQTQPLTPAHESDLLHFYQQAYPGNWFDPYMLQTGQYYGIQQQQQWVSVAGIHVFSPAYQVAALGNIATAHAWRGQGFGSQVTARVCQSLFYAGIETIGLNVKADNEVAKRCYGRLGFVSEAEFLECELHRK